MENLGHQHSNDAAAMAEGQVLLRYLLSGASPPALVERYARAIRQVGTGPAVSLPPLVRRFPALVRFIEAPLKPRTPNQALLRQRLDLAIVLCETSPEGQSLLWRSHGSSRLGTLARLFGNIAMDALAMPVRLIASLAWNSRHGS